MITCNAATASTYRLPYYVHHVAAEGQLWVPQLKSWVIIRRTMTIGLRTIESARVYLRLHVQGGLAAKMESIRKDPGRKTKGAMTGWRPQKRSYHKLTTA